MLPRAAGLRWGCCLQSRACLEISFLQRYLDFDYIIVKTQLFARAKRAPVMPKKSSQAGQGLHAARQGGCRSLCTPSAGPWWRGKPAVGWHRLQTHLWLLCQSITGQQLSLLPRLRKGTAENQADLWKPPASITGECEAVYQHATEFSSQCPILQRRKKIMCNCHVVTV